MMLLWRQIARRTYMVVRVDQVEFDCTVMSGNSRINQFELLQTVLHNIWESDQAALRCGNGTLIPKCPRAPLISAKVEMWDIKDLRKGINLH